MLRQNHCGISRPHYLRHFVQELHRILLRRSCRLPSNVISCMSSCSFRHLVNQGQSVQEHGSISSLDHNNPINERWKETHIFSGKSYNNNRHLKARMRIGSSSFSSSAAAAPTAESANNFETSDTSAGDDNSHTVAAQAEGGYLLQVYDAMVKSNQVHYDLHQVEALTELDRLRQDLGTVQKKHSPKMVNSQDSDIGDGEDEGPERSGFWSKFLSFTTQTTKSASELFRPKPIKGVYLHGGVGCGKTFCMDLFYHSIDGTMTTDGTPTATTTSRFPSSYTSPLGVPSTWTTDPVLQISKQKVHFHKFMLQHVHREMHQIKKSHPKLTADEVLQRVIDAILQRGQVLCFDEFQVTDVADALILRRLFTGLLRQGAIVVITSNRPPADLYIGGIQRDLFLPFIDFLNREMTVVSMWDSETDYRLIAAQHKVRGVYFVGKERNANFDAAFVDLIKGSTSVHNTHVLTSDGRKVYIPVASLQYGVARFSFDDLCRTAMGAADYLAIGENFHTVLVEHVPKLSINEVNLVRRLIVFVDAMYECHVKLIVHAEGKPSELFQVDLNSSTCDEAFAFDRTRSRLEEMGSEAYLKKRWIGSKQGKEKTKDGKVD